MVRVLTKNEGKLSINVEFCEKLDVKLVEGNYLLFDLKNSEIRLSRNKLCCDVCGSSSEGYFNFKGIFFCRKCLEIIKNGEIGTIIY